MEKRSGPVARSFQRRWALERRVPAVPEQGQGQVVELLRSVVAVRAVAVPVRYRRTRSSRAKLR